MDLRVYALAEIRKGGSMSKAPDLSAFPIPRKGDAKPIVADDAEPTRHGGGEGGAPEAPMSAVPTSATAPMREDVSATLRISATGKESSAVPRAPARSAQQPARTPAPVPPLPNYGQVVATTVKLDENRYLRLMEAGKPGPGRLKRRTIQDMLIEALDEWFERRRI